MSTGTIIIVNIGCSFVYKFVGKNNTLDNEYESMDMCLIGYVEKGN